MMFLCVFLYFPTRSEMVSQPGRPVHMKVLLPCSFHSRTCNHGTEAELALPVSPEQLEALFSGEGAQKDAQAFCQQTFTEPLPSSRHCKAHWPYPLESPRLVWQAKSRSVATLQSRMKNDHSTLKTLTGKFRKGFVMVIIATIQIRWLLGAPIVSGTYCTPSHLILTTTPGSWDDPLLQVRKLGGEITCPRSHNQ